MKKILLSKGVALMKSFLKSLIWVYANIAIFCCSLNSCAKEIEIGVTIFLDTFVGVYEGNVIEGKPSDEGIFKYEDDEEGFIVKGCWENGVLTGDVEIEYNDGTKIETTYKNGLISGKVKEYALDGSRKVYNCSAGRPYGWITVYDSEGQKSISDYFYQLQPVSELKSRSLDLEYGFFYENNEYIGEKIKVTGTVKTVCEDSLNAYILLENNEGDLYILSYANKSSEKYAQAVAPVVCEGDKITAYGYFQKLCSFSEIDSLGESLSIANYDENVFKYSFGKLSLEDSDSKEQKYSDGQILMLRRYEEKLPLIVLFDAYTSVSENRDRTKLSFEYDDIVKNPYLYTDLECVISGEVLYTSINNDLNRCYIHVKVSGSDDIYFVRYDFKTGTVLPVVGDSVAISGKFKGNDKYLIDDEEDEGDEYLSGTYIIFPRVHTSKLQIWS